MRYRRKFKEEFILHFDGEKFSIGSRHFIIYGTTGINVDTNVIQVRDDILLLEKGVEKPFSFNALLLIWDFIHPALIALAKKKMLVHRRSS